MIVTHRAWPSLCTTCMTQPIQYIVLPGFNLLALFSLLKTKTNQHASRTAVYPLSSRLRARLEIDKESTSELHVDYA